MKFFVSVHFLHAVSVREGGGLPVPWEEIVDTAHGIAARHAGEDVLEPGVRLYAVELCGFDEGDDDGLSLRAAVGAGEEMVLAAEGYRPDGALDSIIVEFDASILKEAGECGLARQGVADRLCKSPFRRDAGELDLKPDSHLSDERRR